jgi:phenylalanyl-tRNA synthetase alpha subunit
MTKTDELIWKSEELLKIYKRIAGRGIHYSTDIKDIATFEADISQLKEQIKKEEVIKGLSGEKIEDIQTFTTTTNPDIMPDTCCGKYEEEQPLKSAEEIKQQFCNELESILLGVRLKNYKTDDGDSFPLVDHLSEISDNTISSGKEEISNIIEQIYFRLDELSIFASHPTKDITNIPYPNPISKHQTDINIGWMRAMKYMKNQSVKDITDEEIANQAHNVCFASDHKEAHKRGYSEGAKWMRFKMKS